MKRVLVLAALALMLASGSAWAQVAQRGSVTVTVHSADDGTPLPGVTVEARSTQTLTNRVAVTDGNGVAQLVALDPAANYVVTIDLTGFAPARYENVLVQAGRNFNLNVDLQLESFAEELVVTGEAPVVDVTTATTGQDITLELTESLPTGRSYQSYLQLVPGVQEASGGNPASRSGLNYSDIGGSTGSSSDNFYYVEGINVTDPQTGTFSANLNTEIIQEQSVLTGGLPAEFIGAPGLVSNVITKSGGNSFSGSVNYYFQDDSLVADNDHLADAGFSTFDAAATLGGPIVQDKAWFFASYRILNREDDVVSIDNVPLRTVERDDEQAFAKVTWSITNRDLFAGTYLTDPVDFSGSSNIQVANNRNFTTDQGGSRWNATYSRVWDRFTFELGATDHEGDLNITPVLNESINTVIFRGGESPGLAAQQLGGRGTTSLDTRSTEAQRASLEFLTGSSFGDHAIKAGIELSELGRFIDSRTAGDGSTYLSLSNVYQNQNISSIELATESFTSLAFDPTNSSDFGGFINTVNNHPQRAAIYAALDVNGDGTLTQEEVGQRLVFNSSQGNPHGQLNYQRVFQVTGGEQFYHTEGTVYFLQDTWQWNKLAVNLGARAEKWEHFGSDGNTNIYTFPEDVAPRLSVAYDLKGDGRQRISAYSGRYYDPIRTNMTNFAGQLTGLVRDEQVWVGAINDWVTYRTRGGAQDPDAFFALTTETPYTDEYMLGYKIDLGRNMSFETNLIKRETDNILEDYDLHLYSDPEGYGLPLNDPNSLFIPVDYFGFGAIPPSNFIIATLLGGQRDWEGLELIFRKRYSDNWQFQASYNYADAEGNTNSDSNADFQGDVLFLDPRAINQYGTQPGLVEHLFKLGANYRFDNGFSLGGTYRWNSGVIISRTFLASSRHLPIRDVTDPEFGQRIDFAGQSGGWLSPLAVGNFEHDSYGTLDLRLAYLLKLGGSMEMDFFVDVFNALDDQAATRKEDLVAGGAGTLYNEEIDWVDPQRFYLGARLRF